MCGDTFREQMLVIGNVCRIISLGDTFLLDIIDFAGDKNREYFINRDVTFRYKNNYKRKDFYCSFGLYGLNSLQYCIIN